VASNAGVVFLAAGLRALGLDGGLAGSLAGSNVLDLSGVHRLVSRVQALHQSTVLKRVLLGLGVKSVVALHDSQLALDGITVDDLGEVSNVHEVSLELIATLLDALLAVGAEDVVQGLKGILGEDHEATDVTTWSELEEVQSVDVADINAWEVAGRSLDVLVVVTVDDQGTLAEDEAGVPHLALARSLALVVTSTPQVMGGVARVVESLEQFLGVFNIEVVEDQWELWDFSDVVATGLNQRSASRGGKSSGNSVSVLVGVGLSVPSSPDLERGKHAALTALVAEGTLA